MSRYYPASRKGGRGQGDFVDGRLTFETEHGTYRLEKEWGEDNRVTLRTPDGVLRAAGKIDELVRQALGYGEGVYNEMLLSSQRNTDSVLKTLLDASAKSDAKQEITDAASQAFAESDGISMDAIEEGIAQKILEIGGKHWDSDRDAPVRRADRWSKGLGDILKAYYAQEDAQKVLDELFRLSNEADRAAERYKLADQKAGKAAGEAEKFRTYAARLLLEKAHREKQERLEEDQNKYNQVLTQWPKQEANCRKAEALLKERADRETLDQLAAAEKAARDLNGVDQMLLKRECPTPGDIREVKNAQNSIRRLGNQLCGMNLNAMIHMLEGHSVEITSVRTGEKLAVDGEKLALTEAVKITVPGVMEMELIPADVDAAQVERDIAAQSRRCNAVLKKYQVDSAEALEALRGSIGDARLQADRFEGKLNDALKGQTLEELREKAGQVDEAAVRSAEEISQAVTALCGREDLVGFQASAKTVVDGYCKEYGSMEQLAKKLKETGEALEALEGEETSLEDIPEEYRKISDPQGYQTILDSAEKQTREEMQKDLSAKSEAAGRLESYRETIVGDPEEQLAQAQRHYQETRELLHHWQHIQQVFEERKAAVHDNPMEDISRSFRHYLELISGGRVVSEFPEEDKLQMNIYSDDYQVDYEKLSEGTKETVSLAFRLAVLDHLFPEGGGLAVFDDPFTDMDRERMLQACALLKECAQRHQIIVMTCREEYIELLGGHTVRV